MKEIALTIDDLPRYEFTSACLSPSQIIRNIIGVLAENRLNEVYGFMNGLTLENNPDDIKIIRDWLDSGHLLGNHTYSHYNAAEVDPELFIQDIETNTLTIKMLSRKDNPKLFRFPYLMEGSTAENSQIIKDYLQQNQYTLAEVTVDYLDFAWDKPLEVCLQAQRKDLIENLRELYVATALVKAQNALEAAQAIAKCDIKHIMLTHCCLATAYFLDDALKALANNGWRFISVTEAVKDTFYKLKPVNLQHDGPNFLMRLVSDSQLDLANNKPCVPFQKLKSIQAEATAELTT